MEKLLSKIRQYYTTMIIWGVACILMLLFSKASPLYTLNDLPDSNTWLVQARMVLNGKILYREVYGHQGPLQILLYLFAALPCFQCFQGLFILEIVALTITGCIFFQTAKIELSGKKSLIATILALTVTCASSAFTNSGCCEELLLFSFAYPIMFFYRRLKTEDPFTPFETIMIGLAASLHFWTKYSLCIFDFILLVFAVYIYAKRKWNIVKSILFYLVGVLFVSTPIFIYFLLKGALTDLFYVYFYTVLFKYGAWNTYSPTWMQLSCNIVVLLCAVLFARPRFNGEKGKFIFGSFLILLVIWAAISPFWSYYFLPLYAYMGIFAVEIVKTKRSALKAILLTLVIFVLNDNQLETLKYDENEYGQLQVCSIISKKQDAKVALIYAENAGYYVYSGAEPFMRYFTYFNMNSDEQKKEIDDVVNQKEADYIICSQYIEGMESMGYHLVLETTCPKWDVYMFLGKTRTYTDIYLYENLGGQAR